MSAPEGEAVPIDQEEAIERVQELVDDDRELHSLIFTGGDTDYAWIYLALTSGKYNGNDMLWIRYVWLSKPGAFESDMWGENGMSVRMVPGMADAFIKGTLAACNALKAGGREGSPPRYSDATDLAGGE